MIGAYDGFYGPGTGTFLIIAFTIFAKMNVRPIILIVLALLFTKMLLDF